MKKYVVNGKEFMNKEQSFDEVLRIIREKKSYIQVKEKECEVYFLTNYNFILNEEFRRLQVISGEGNRLKCIILEEGLKIPIKNKNGGTEYFDTKIKSLNTGNIYYVGSEYLVNVKEFNPGDYPFKTMPKFVLSMTGFESLKGGM